MGAVLELVRQPKPCLPWSFVKLSQKLSWKIARKFSHPSSRWPLEEPERHLLASPLCTALHKPHRLPCRPWRCPVTWLHWQPYLHAWERPCAYHSARWGDVVPRPPQWSSLNSGHFLERKLFLGWDPSPAHKEPEDILVRQTFCTPCPWCCREQPLLETLFIGLVGVLESTKQDYWKTNVGGCWQTIGTLFSRKHLEKLDCSWAVGHVLL